MPVAFAFPFRQVPVRGARPMFRPVLDVRIRGPAGSSPTRMLVDSGADCSVIGAPLAEGVGLTLVDGPPGRGIASRIPAWRSTMVVEVRHASGWMTPIEVPVEVPVQGEPPINVLGREGFFESYDIVFRLGPAPERGMFCLVPRTPAARVFPESPPRHRHRRARPAA